MLSILIPSRIKNYTSSTFVSLGYNFLFNSYLTSIKKGQIVIEIYDENYPQYKTAGSPLKFGSLDNEYEYENICVNIKIYDLYGFLTKVIFGHDIGIGESYILGNFKCDNLKGLIKIFVFNFESIYNNKSKLLTFLNDNVNLFTNYLYNKSINDSSNAIKAHYNISNEMYEIMLGKAMCYSSALYKSKDEPLYDAQIRKLHSLIDKAKITKDHHILEIGCGWATCLIEAVKKTGCKATGISLSEEQVNYGRELVKKEGLEHLIDIQVCHYKDVKGKYDRIISIEMMEHIGSEHHGEFFNIVDNLLKPDGIFVFQVITCRDKDYEINRMNKNVGFINKYIFLGSELASVTTIIKAASEHSSLELQDAESIGQHYSITLDQWNQNLMSNQEKIKQLGLDQQFINMFEYYLNYCSALFETKYINDFQMVYSRPLNTKNLNINYYN